MPDHNFDYESNQIMEEHNRESRLAGSVFLGSILCVAGCWILWGVGAAILAAGLCVLGVAFAGRVFFCLYTIAGIILQKEQSK